MSSTIYKANILDHYKNPRNFKKITDFTHQASLNNLTCGDEMEVFVNIDEDKIKDIAFQARGCAISIAAMSMLTEHLKNKQANSIEEITNESVLKMLGLQEDSPRIKCALLGIETLKKALSS